MKTTTTFYFLLLLLIWGSNQQLNAQGPSTAYDFRMDDCNGKMHHLFSELDSGNVIVMEFFMISCSPCIVAGKALDAMMVPLKKKYGEKTRFYQIGFTKSYTCAQVKDWISTNGFATSVPFDSGDVQVAYYGGMGMPSVAVAAGKNHDVLFSSIDFKPNTDTAIIAKAIHTFFNINEIETFKSFDDAVSIFPNPSSGNFTISLNTAKPQLLHLSITNLEGQTIADFSTEYLKSGPWSKTITLPLLKNGIYILKGDVSGHPFTKKISVLNQ